MHIHLKIHFWEIGTEHVICKNIWDFFSNSEIFNSRPDLGTNSQRNSTQNPYPSEIEIFHINYKILNLLTYINTECIKSKLISKI